MNIEKFRFGLKIFIVVLTITLLITAPISIINYSKSQTENSSKQSDCIKKGNICTLDEIFKGVEVTIQVSDTKKYTFNVISNDENTMTLQMNENIINEVDWHGELINIKGPQTAIENLLNATKDWNKIKPISTYEYIDSGKLVYEKQCSAQTAEAGYDCTTTYHPTRGYNSININNGLITMKTNIAPIEPGEEVNNEYSFTDHTSSARLITREEIINLTKKDTYPNWLISNLKTKEGYWTLTSATSIKASYSQGAVAITNKNNVPSIDDLHVMHQFEENYTIGIRPVITVDK